MSDVDLISKIQIDFQSTPLCIMTLHTAILQLEKSGGNCLTIKNVTRDDLELMKEALSFYHKIHYDMAEIFKATQATGDLILELVKENRNLIEQIKKSQGQQEKNLGLDSNLRRKI